MTKQETVLLNELVKEIQSMRKSLEHYSQYAYEWGTCVKAMTNLYDSNLKMIEWKREDNERLKEEISRLNNFHTYTIFKN